MITTTEYTIHDSSDNPLYGNTAKELKINRFCQKFLPIDESRGFLFDIFGEKLNQIEENKEAS